MKENQSRRDQRNTDKKSINGWKWAFISLVGLMVGLVLYLMISVQPVSVHSPNTEPIPTTADEIELTTSINKADAEQMINLYLDESIGADFENYEVVLTNQLEIYGMIEVFSFDVPFTLYFDPYVQENGNIQLRGEAVELANFSLPVSGVMSLLANQVELPHFIAVDSADQMIMIHLNELTEKMDIGVSMTKIDLEADELELKLRLDEGTITNQIQSESTER